MRILVACEESQAVTKELRKLGHEAYSCDLLPTSGWHPEWHIQADALEVAKMDWDMCLAFPPCTHLATSGAPSFPQKRGDGRQQSAIGFFLAFTALDHIPFVAIENPVGIMSTEYRKPDQIISPHMFGDPVRKNTCLWLKNLPPLVPTNVVEPETFNYESRPNVSDSQWHLKTLRLPPNVRRMERGKTYPGIAKAMARQWGDEDRLRRLMEEGA